MARRSHIAAPLPNYVVSETGGRFQVTHRLSGYTITEHQDSSTAHGTAERLCTDPVAAITASRALSDALPKDGPQIVRRFRALALKRGYRWTLPHHEAVTALFGADGYRFRLDAQLTEQVQAGLLAEVWDTTGMPYMTTPERFAELPITCRDDEGTRLPTALPDMLGRRRARLDAMSDSARNERCELHSMFVTTCCPPVEEWECDWAFCRANAVTTLIDRGTGRTLCADCALSHYFPRLRRVTD